jgi:hypothetical protein
VVVPRPLLMFTVITMDKMKIAAVDFETTYDKVCSIKPLGWDAYFRHPLFECYLVAIKTEEGLEWVGHPLEAPWAKIAGHHWISHNAGFDENLYLIAQEMGWWGDLPTPPTWDCTMDLMAYCGYPHSLKNAVKDRFGIELSKEVRSNAVGKRPIEGWPCINTNSLDHWEPMSNDAWQAMLDYALGDSEWCLKLWEACAKQWPEGERWLSRHTRQIARRGVPCDLESAEVAAHSLKKVLFEFEGCIPWSETDALLSRAAFDRQCAKNNLEPPESLAQDNAETNAWLGKHEAKHEWIYAYRNWRKANALLKKVEAVMAATRDAGGHYRYFGQMKYCGAHTKRWSGSGGNLNMQNPPKGTQHFQCNGHKVEVKFRDFFKAPEGMKLAALDLSQIEVRTLTWLAKDQPMLERIANSEDIYQAFAEGFHLWSPDRGVLKDEDKDLRQMVKALVLGSGFGASAWAFSDKYTRELGTSVANNYPPGPKEHSALGKEWLIEMKRKGCWWWKKAGRMLVRDIAVKVEKETPKGDLFLVDRPQWKEFAKLIEKWDKILKRSAPVPIDLDDWHWDWDSVLIMKEATHCVNLYREQMTFITKFWERLTRTLTTSVKDEEMEFELPSGNRLKYRGLHKLKKEEGNGDSIYCTVVKNGSKKPMKLWYGLLAENLAQSLARDVFANSLRLLEDAGYKILFHVHDEVVVELPEKGAPELVKKAEEIMSIAPVWIQSLPVAAEGNLGNTYADCK